MEKKFCIYILSNEKGTLYIGVTSNLAKRITEHQLGIIEGFTQKYNIKKLLYYEQHDSAEAAISREKRLKHWKRDWKLELIHQLNPDMDDLSKKLDY